MILAKNGGLFKQGIFPKRCRAIGSSALPVAFFVVPESVGTGSIKDGAVFILL